MAEPKPISEEEAKYILSVLDYNPDTGVFTWRKSRRGAKLGSIAGTRNGEGYTIIMVNRRPYRASRLAFLFMKHPLPEYADHINGIRDDDRWKNLRPCNHSQNQQNKIKLAANTSGYKGVSWDKRIKKWLSQIYVNKKRIRLGYFDCPKKAHDAYCEASKKYHGQFANTG